MIPVNLLLVPPAALAELGAEPSCLARFVLIITHTTDIVSFPFLKAYDIDNTLL